MTLPTPGPSGHSHSLSQVLVSLMKGVVYQESDPGLWQALLHLQGHVRDHVTTLGLQLMLDEAEGYAYLRQRPAAEGEPELPRLVPRRQLSYGVSLLLALLRKKLAEADSTGGGSRLVLRRDDILDMVRLFLPDGTNEARLVDRLDADIARVVELGFLRRLRDSDEAFEVRRILKAFVDAQWLGTFEQKLADYRAHLAEEGGGTA
ncbi:DUF4194 domain-containing protein [Archangium sp.]|uniref:DUF4194 domain-containing protein n=1 Tax=Archangium sp. TaxID=1872627 RepID=UPI00286A24E1|nr:DUF4194 domain-containing protein [Archangium sp.]